MTVAVLSNIDGLLPDTIARQLMTVAVGQPVTLPPIRQSRPLASAVQNNLVGDYLVGDPAFSMTIRRSGNDLFAVSGGRDFAAYYIGDARSDPKLYIPRIEAELLFAGGRDGPAAELSFIQLGTTLKGVRSK